MADPDLTMGVGEEALVRLDEGVEMEKEAAFRSSILTDGRKGGTRARIGEHEGLLLKGLGSVFFRDRWCSGEAGRGGKSRTPPRGLPWQKASRDCRDSRVRSPCFW